MKCGEILMIYLHRYIRLTPTLGLVILFYTNVLPYIVTGPGSVAITQTDILQKPCYDYWWTVLLYINNFYPVSSAEGCVGWTWYLANDMQFYVVAPGILLLMLLVERISKNQTKAILNNLILIFLMSLLSMLITGIITGYYDISALMTVFMLPGNPRAKQSASVMDKLYEKPYVRITPYLVGIFLGYLISRDVTLNVKRGKMISFFGWISAGVMACLVVYGPWNVFKEHGTFFNDSENVMYAACHRFVWGAAVAWVIYACHNKYGGLVDAFLSWKAWIPLSRLTYSGYLLHLVVMYYFMFVREVVSHYQDSFAVFDFISLTVISYACAFILTVCVEYPILNLEKMMFKR